MQYIRTQYADPLTGPIRNTDTEYAIRRPAHGSNTEYGYGIRNTQTHPRAHNTEYGYRIRNTQTHPRAHKYEIGNTDIRNIRIQNTQTRSPVRHIRIRNTH